MSAIAAAWAATFPARVMELKICEAGCNKTFVRPVPLSAKSGAKLCAECQRMTHIQREAQFLRVRRIGRRVRQGDW